jgi:hypothetical protein
MRGLETHDVDRAEDTAYVESDSDLGDEMGGWFGKEDGLDLEDGDLSGQDGKDWEDDKGESGDEDKEEGPRWKSNLLSCATQTFTQSSRCQKVWTNLIYRSGQSAQEVIFGTSTSNSTLLPLMRTRTTCSC